MLLSLLLSTVLSVITLASNDVFQNQDGLICWTTIEVITGEAIWKPTPNAPAATSTGLESSNGHTHSPQTTSGQLLRSSRLYQSSSPLPPYNSLAQPTASLGGHGPRSSTHQKSSSKTTGTKPQQSAWDDWLAKDRGSSRNPFAIPSFGGKLTGTSIRSRSSSSLGTSTWIPSVTTKSHSVDVSSSLNVTSLLTGHTFSKDSATSTYTITATTQLGFQHPESASTSNDVSPVARTSSGTAGTSGSPIPIKSTSNNPHATTADDRVISKYPSGTKELTPNSASTSKHLSSALSTSSIAASTKTVNLSTSTMTTVSTSTTGPAPSSVADYLTTSTTTTTAEYLIPTTTTTGIVTTTSSYSSTESATSAHTNTSTTTSEYVTTGTTTAGIPNTTVTGISISTTTPSQVTSSTATSEILTSSTTTIATSSSTREKTTSSTTKLIEEAVITSTTTTKSTEDAATSTTTTTTSTGEAVTSSTSTITSTGDAATSTTTTTTSTGDAATSTTTTTTSTGDAATSTTTTTTSTGDAATSTTTTTTSTEEMATSTTTTTVVSTTTSTADTSIDNTTSTTALDGTSKTSSSSTTSQPATSTSQSYEFFSTVTSSTQTSVPDDSTTTTTTSQDYIMTSVSTTTTDHTTTVTSTSYTVFTTQSTSQTTSTITSTSKSSTTSTTITKSDGSGTTSTFSGPVNLGSVPLATLLPVQPPDIDMGSLQVLNPGPKNNLWFNGANAGGDGSDGAVTVRISIQYKYKSVVLDHSIYIDDAQCSTGTLSSSFNNTLSLQHAISVWNTHPMIFITSSSRCRTDGQPLFFQSSAITFNGNRFSVIGRAVDLLDIYEQLDIDFGKIDYTVPLANGTAATCGSPSSPIIRGLPAISCGTSFDKNLDDKLGYYGDNGPTEQEVLALAGAPNQKRLGGRGLFDWLEDIFEAVVDFFVDLVSTIYHAVIEPILPPFLKEAVDWVATSVKKVIDIGVQVVKTAIKLVGFLVTGDYTQSLRLNIDLVPPPASLGDSPWGSAFKFYSWAPDKGGEKWTKSAHALEKIESSLIGEPDPEPGIEFFCVNCGISGKIVATGSVSATPLSGLKRATIGINGNLYAGLYLGVNAFAQYEAAYEKEIYTKGLPGWSIPGIVSLGPMLTLAVEAKVEVEAEGQLLTGASVSWPAFQASLDFLDDSRSTSSGWVPTIQKTFQAQGTLGITASLGLPVKVEFGINILEGTFKKTAALVDTPAIAAHAELTISLDVDADEPVSVGDEDCAGIAWDISLTNEVSLEVDDIGTWTLFEWSSPPLAEGCIQIGSSGGGGGTDEESGNGDSGGSSNGSAGGTDPTKTGNGTTTTPPANTGDLIPQPGEPGYLCGNTVAGAHSNYASVSSGGVYTDQAFYNFDIECGQNYVGTAAGANAANFEECIKMCVPYSTNTIDSCAGVGWWSGYYGGEATCLIYHQSYLRSPSANSAVAFAKLRSPFMIHSATWAIWDVTQEAQETFPVGSVLSLVSNYWAAELGDPTPSEKKHLHMIYQYGAELRSYSNVARPGYWASDQDFIIAEPGGLRFETGYPAGMERAVPKFDIVNKPASFRIIDIAFGIGLVPIGVLQSVFQTVYDAVASGNAVGFNSKTFKYDGYAGVNGDTGRRIGTIFIEQASNPGVIISIIHFENTVAAASEFTDPPKKRKRDVPLGLAERGHSHQLERRVTATTMATVTTTTATLSSTTAVSTTSPRSPFALATMAITDATKSIQLNIGLDNNLFLSNPSSGEDISTLVSGASISGDSSTGIILGSSTGQILHYHPDEMNAVGASRLRVASWDKLPIGSKIISLVPFSSNGFGSTANSALVAIDMDQNVYWPFMCGILEQLNKVFLVKNPSNGKQTLMDPDLKFTVVGGEAHDCGPVALQASFSQYE